MSAHSEQLVKMFKHRYLIASVIAFVVTTAVGQGALVVERLSCEYLTNPLGIDAAQPRLSWIVTSPDRGAVQSAYRILVASSQAKLQANEGDLWDTGKRSSSETVLVPYAGSALKSRRQCFWKVQVWDQADKPSEWSDAAHWSMGLLENSDWSARFISFRDKTPVHNQKEPLFLPAARQYRREFPVAQRAVTKATIYASALGVYELMVNGQRVGDAYLAPGWTDYATRLHYQTYDVTDIVRQGKNAIGAYVADGWYAGYLGYGLLDSQGTEAIGRYTYGKTPAFIAQLEIEYEDGSRELIRTDNQWKVTDQGPIQEADLLMGEFYDARRELTGWSTADFDDSSWDGAILAEENGHPMAVFHEQTSDPAGIAYTKKITRPIDLGFKQPKLEAFNSVPIRATLELPAKEITEPEPGVYLFDLGQNFAGVVRLNIRGEAGLKLTLRHGEMLYPDGKLMTVNLRKARAIDTYICRGDQAGETWQPRFTTHGFRYVEVTGLETRPPLETITGIVLHSDTPMVSQFECSDPMVNQLYKNILWTQRSNFVDLPTDCPQRDERLGWTGDAQIYMRTATLNAQVGAFYTKWLNELMTSQRPNGPFPPYSPYMIENTWDFGTAYTDAGVICPWTLWQAYGDTRIIRQCWPNMQKFIRWRESASNNFLGIRHGHTWGDWLFQGEETPIEFVDTVYFAYSTKLLAEIAAALGEDAEAQRLAEVFASIKQAFGTKYLTKEGQLNVDTQTAHALTLWVGLAPIEYQQQIADRLASKIQQNGNRMTTGFLGTNPLMQVLSQHGHHDVATFLLQSRTFPSWGYEVENGATTIWERWDSYTKEDGFGKYNAEMNSFSHYAFGSVCEWMLRSLAGIDCNRPGYEEIRIAPLPPAPSSNQDYEAINWVNASYDSIRGPIEVAWKVDQLNFDLKCRVPANTTTEVCIPARKLADVSEGGTPLAESSGIMQVREEAGRVVVQVKSGSYHFHSTGALTPREKGLTVRQAIETPVGL